MAELVTSTPAGWRRLADAVRDRRRALQLTQEDVETLGGPSGPSVRRIERAAADSYRVRTLADLERALDWPTGYVATLLSPQPGDATVEVGGQLVDVMVGAQLVDTIRVRQPEPEPVQAPTIGELASAIGVLRGSGHTKVAAYLASATVNLGAA